MEEAEHKINTNSSTCIGEKNQESAHYHPNTSAYIVKTDINNTSDMGLLHKTLIILKLDLHCRLFHWKRGFTVHFGFKNTKQGTDFRVGKDSIGIRTFALLCGRAKTKQKMTCCC